MTIHRRPATQSSRPSPGFAGQRSNTLLLILAVILTLVAVILVYLLATQAFKPYFNCKHLIDDSLHTQNLNTSLCDGAALYIAEREVIPAINILGGWGIERRTFGPLSIPLLPPMKPIDGPLETARTFVAWNIILVFALLSLGLAYIVVKIKDFAALLLSPEGRKMILTNLSVWLLIFAIFCSLFYFWTRSPGG
jgi:hypothetical protein